MFFLLRSELMSVKLFENLYRKKGISFKRKRYFHYSILLWKEERYSMSL